MLSILFFVLPIDGHISSTIIGGGGPDWAAFTWELSWWPYAIIHHINPFITTYIYSPHGYNLAWAASIPAVSLLLSPLTLIFGPVASYNIAVVMSPAIAALSFYLLSKEISSSTFASVVGGYFFGFSVYEFSYMIAELNLMLIYVVPLFIWLTVMKCKQKISDTHYIVFGVLVLSMMFYTSKEVFTTFTFFGFIALLILYAMHKNIRKVLHSIVKSIVIIYIFTLIIAIPDLYYFILGWNNHNHIPNPPAMYSSDLLSYFILTPMTLLGKILWPYIHNFAGSSITHERQNAFIGILALVVVAIYYRLSKGVKRHRFTASIALFTFIAFVLSFGPAAKIDGAVIPLPWVLFMHLPVLPAVLPVRFNLYVLLGISLLIVMSLDYFKSFSKGLAYLVSLMLLVFIIPNTGIYHAKLYSPIFLKKGIHSYAPKNTVLMVLPYGYIGTSMAWQAMDGFYYKEAGGYVAAALPQMYLQNNNLRNAYMLLTLEEKPYKGYQKAIKSLLCYSHAKYIVLVPHAHSLRGNTSYWIHLLEFIGHPKKVEGSYLYNISGLCNLKNSKIYNAFSMFRNASIKYYDKNRTFNVLDPDSLEQLGLIPKSLGYMKNPLLINFTNNGYWIGAWGKSYAIGYKPANYNMASYLYKKYSKSIESIYFPYPKIFNRKEKGKHLAGEVIIQFKFK